MALANTLSWIDAAPLIHTPSEHALCWQSGRGLLPKVLESKSIVTRRRVFRCSLRSFCSALHNLDGTSATINAGTPTGSDQDHAWLCSRTCKLCRPTVSFSFAMESASSRASREQPNKKTTSFCDQLQVVAWQETNRGLPFTCSTS